LANTVILNLFQDTPARHLVSWHGINSAVTLSRTAALDFCDICSKSSCYSSLRWHLSMDRLLRFVRDDDSERQV